MIQLKSIIMWIYENVNNCINSLFQFCAKYVENLSSKKPNNGKYGVHSYFNSNENSISSTITQ
jgi:hypothetical protein